MFVDGIYESKTDTVKIVERVDGKRLYKNYKADHSFHVETSPNHPTTGGTRSIYGDAVEIIKPTSNKDAQKEKAIHSSHALFESDVSPVFRCLSTEYLQANNPKLNIAFFDIEADFDKDIGFSDPEDPYAKITAISTHCSWLNEMVTLAIPPNDIPMNLAEEMTKDFPNCYLFKTEAELLDAWLNLIDDADIVTGWFSEGYDIPYLVNRVIRVLSKSDLRRFCLWDKMPKKREYDRGGKMATTYDLIGRVHLDYMNLYKKYTYHEMHSYSLDAISEYELGERKVPYKGTLDQLYNNDFPTFIEYNRQDVMLIKKLDDKHEFIELTNTLAHENTVLMPSTMGTVAMIEQAILNKCHALDLVAPDRKKKDDSIDHRAAGAFVATPRRGVSEWEGLIDIKSIYPNSIITLNMSPETIIGQLRPVMTTKMINDYEAAAKKHTFAGAWEGHFGSLEYQAVMEQRTDIEITIDWEEGSSDVLTASDIYKLIFQNDAPWMLSANGTIFTTEKIGIIPLVLMQWYNERKEMQVKMAKAKTAEEKAFWDKRQHVKKINLNSLYGAILNKYCRFYDKRIGQSTTLSGRTITKHMMSKVNEIISGDYAHEGEAIVYGDTDSVYFTAYPALKQDIYNGEVEWNKEVCLDMYKQIVDAVNESFPAEMKRCFNCPEEFGKNIKGGLELISRRGLHVKKKKYGVLSYWHQDYGRLDQGEKPGKMIAKGLDLKRSDTPEFMQDFLEKILWDLLNESTKEEIIEKINNFRDEFSKKESWEKGVPKKVNNLTKYTALEEKGGKANLPGHVRAAMNYNNLRRMYADNYAMSIMDGQKTIVCKLKNHPLGFTSVGYPIDENNLPNWFKELPFDDIEMEQIIIDKKVKNLLGVLPWYNEIPNTTDSQSTFDDWFEVEE